MRRAITLALIATNLVACADPSLAQNAKDESRATRSPAPEVVLPPGVTEEHLRPPPVPQFMLEKPAKPLTMDEMLKQTREAEEKARTKPKAPENEPKTQPSKPAN